MGLVFKTSMIDQLQKDKLKEAKMWWYINFVYSSRYWESNIPPDFAIQAVIVKIILYAP